MHIIQTLEAGIRSIHQTIFQCFHLTTIISFFHCVVLSKAFCILSCPTLIPCLNPMSLCSSLQQFHKLTNPARSPLALKGNYNRIVAIYYFIKRLKQSNFIIDSQNSICHICQVDLIVLGHLQCIGWVASQVNFGLVSQNKQKYLI